MEEKLKPIKCECCGIGIKTAVLHGKQTSPQEGMKIEPMNAHRIKDLLMENLLTTLRRSRNRKTNGLIKRIGTSGQAFGKMEELVDWYRDEKEKISLFSLSFSPWHFLVCNDCAKKFETEMTLSGIEREIENIKIKPLFYSSLEKEYKEKFQKKIEKWIKENKEKIIVKVEKTPIEKFSKKDIKRLNLKIIK